MPRIPGFIVLILSLAAAWPAFPQAVPGGRGVAVPGGPVRDPRGAVPSGTARVSGRVVNNDGAPLRRAQVTIAADASILRRITTTDAEGRYEFTDLPAARFTLSASKAGYVTTQYGQRRPNEPGTPLTVSDGENRARVDFTLPRGGVIAGRITDEFGEPVAGAQVQALRYTYQPDGQRRLGAGSGFMQTDDLGQFRVYGLAPGEYVVSATVRTFTMTTPGAPSQDTNEGYPPTYYPGTVNRAEAQTVGVSANQESSVQFSLIAARLSRISGTIVDSQGNPVTTATVMFRSGDSTGSFVTSVAQNAADGGFNIANVEPGSHVIDVRLSRPGGGSEFASVPVTTNGSDISGLRIVTGTGGRMSGRVVFEGDAQAAAKSGPALRIIAQPADLSRPAMVMLGADPLSNGLVQEDGTFVVESVSGPVLIRISTSPKVTLKSVTADGQDVTDMPLDLAGRESLTNLRIVLTDRVSDISGQVSTSQGEVSKDYSVVIVPADPIEGLAQTRYIRLARGDSDGRFDVRGLPSSRYVAVAIRDDAFENGEQFSPEFQDRVRRAGRSFSLKEGENLSLDLSMTGSL